MNWCNSSPCMMILNWSQDEEQFVITSNGNLKENALYTVSELKVLC